MKHASVPGSLPAPRREAQLIHITRNGVYEAGATADPGPFTAGQNV